MRSFCSAKASHIVCKKNIRVFEIGPLGTFASNFVYLCNLTWPSHWYAELLIAQPAGLHYNHCVSPSVRPLSVSENRNQLAKTLITLEPHGIF